MLITRGTYKGREGKVIEVYRRKWAIHIERIQREKVNTQVAPIHINPSKVVITKLHMTKDREELLKKKADGRSRQRSDLASSA